jgi:hypothetical protein
MAASVLTTFMIRVGDSLWYYWLPYLFHVGFLNIHYFEKLFIHTTGEQQVYVLLSRVHLSQSIHE